MKMRWLAAALLPSILLSACAATPAYSSPSKHRPPLHYKPVNSMPWGTITSGGKCLTGTPKDGVAVAGKTCNGTNEQQWNMSLDGTLTMRASGGAYCLDNAGNRNPIKGQMWQCNEDNAQHWSYALPGIITAKTAGAGFHGHWVMNGVAFPGFSNARGDVSLSGVNMVVGGKLYLPLGMNLNGTQYPYGTDPGEPDNKWYLDGSGQPQYDSWISQAEDQEDVSASSWHANTVRIFISQDTLVDPATGDVDSAYLSGLQQVISHAQSDGLMVVIVDQTEPDPIAHDNQPLPTQTTVNVWKALAPTIAGDKSVIIDPFNEPRSDDSMTDNSMWSLWLNGGYSGDTTYIGMNQLTVTLRANGYTNMLWDETPQFPGVMGELGLGRVASNFSSWHVTDPDKLTVYEFHHPTVDGVARTTANWDAEFGQLVKHLQAPVVDGEWTNRTVTSGNPGSLGDVGECWGDAPASVPAYLRYLQDEGIGLLAWTLGTGDVNGAGILNQDNSGPATANSYDAGTYSCVLPDGPTQGAGQDLQSWFGTLNP
jgi:hypothetical protein